MVFSFLSPLVRGVIFDKNFADLKFVLRFLGPYA